MFKIKTNYSVKLVTTSMNKNMKLLFNILLNKI